MVGGEGGGVGMDILWNYKLGLCQRCSLTASLCSSRSFSFMLKFAMPLECSYINLLYNFPLAEVDAQINTKLKEIERMKLEVSSLKLKRKRCDIEVDKLHKRLMSCDNALKEIPGSSHSSPPTSM